MGIVLLVFQAFLRMVFWNKFLISCVNAIPSAFESLFGQILTILLIPKNSCFDGSNAVIVSQKTDLF